MASIHTRGKKHYVVVSVRDAVTQNFEAEWIPCDTMEQAEALKARVEKEEAEKAATNEPVTNATRTLAQLIARYVRLVGRHKWGLKSYPDYVARINNYILPHIGTWKVWECTTEKLDEYFADLREFDAVIQVGKAPKKISNKVINEVHKFLKALFNQAMDWGYIDKNPCRKMNSTITKHISKERPFWTRDTFMGAASLIEQEKDFMLLVSMFLSVGTTMREGEISGLRWEDVYISEKDFSKRDCKVLVNREIERVYKSELQRKSDDVLFVYPGRYQHSKSVLVAKPPKSDTSDRTIWLPNTVARMLLQLKALQDEEKAFLGSDYHDYGLVFATPDGWPIEGRVFNERLQRVIEKHGLPPITFHSFRKTGTTYKLKFTQGDVKAVQGDTGHADPQILLNVYAGILDEDRQGSAELFDNLFFKGEEKAEPAYATVEKPQQPAATINPELLSAVQLLQNNPELLKVLLATQASA